MNHDVTHCLDISQSCPKTCYWYKLEQDLKKRWFELHGIPISYMHLKSMGFCGRKGAEDEQDD